MDVFEMKFAKVFPLLIAKAERKGRTRNEVFEVIKFIDNAPTKNPVRMNIKGRICGIKVEEIEDPRMRDLRILDKLVDELAKGKELNMIIHV